jgi:glucosylceramidase
MQPRCQNILTMKRLFKTYTTTSLLAVAVLVIAISCSKKSTGGGDPAPGGGTPVPPPETPVKTDVAMWLTMPDRSVLFQKLNTSLLFSVGTNSNATIEVDTTQVYQPIDGFGYSLTGGSATLINKLATSDKDALLKELFLADGSNIGVSYLRISIGASDLSAETFTYDEVPAGQTDPNLTKFTIDKEREDLIPVLKKIVALNPAIKILACPWTPPTWMKTNNAYKGGSLKPEFYDAYARYFVKYIQAMKAEGITIDAITPQNEPLHPGNVPSLLMLAEEQTEFIKTNLGPRFKEAGISTKIIAYDHNADRPDYPLTILKDAGANQFVDGSAFHLYAGDISALTAVHNAYPAKNVYFTEQWVGGPGNFSADLKWHINTLIIGATRNWSRNVLEWNLAADQFYGPHTDGGCTTCLGALTIASSSVSRNVAYYIIAHAAKFVRPGSVRIGSNTTTDLPNVAFKTPDGKKVLVTLNNTGSTQTFNIKFNGKMVTSTLSAGAVATYVW